MINSLVKTIIKIKGKGSWTLKQILQLFISKDYVPGVVTRNGKKWLINDLRNNAAACIFWGTEYSSFGEEMIEKYVKKNDIVIDIGANIGIFTIFLSNKVGDEGKVFAIEASHIHSKVLRENVRLQQALNVTIIEKAVGNETGIIDHYTTHSSGSLISGFTDFGMEVIEKKSVEVDILKNLIPDIRVDFIKIDVDGNEFGVIIGSQDIINKYKPNILIEISEHTLIKAGTTSIQLLKKIQKLGYLFITEFTGDTAVEFDELIQHVDPELFFFDALCIPVNNKLAQ